jgi:hypothetical protein
MLCFDWNFLSNYLSDKTQRDDYIQTRPLFVMEKNYLGNLRYGLSSVRSFTGGKMSPNLSALCISSSTVDTEYGGGALLPNTGNYSSTRYTIPADWNL